MSEDSSFVHLNVHTQYSLLNSCISIPNLMEKVGELGMPAVAITDDGNLYGAVEFYLEAKKRNIHPILGCEISLALETFSPNKNRSHERSFARLTLLAENNEGWKNLICLVTQSHLQSLSKEFPVVDFATLKKHSSGIICLSDCLASPMVEFLSIEDDQSAEEALISLRDLYGEKSFFIDLQDEKLVEQESFLLEAQRFSKKLGIPCTCSNHVHFLKEEDFESHEAMICIREGKLLIDESKPSCSPEKYLKNSEKMRGLFPQFPEAYKNLMEIVNRADVHLNFASDSSKYPSFPLTEGFSKEGYLKKISYEGLKRRYPNSLKKSEIQERLDYELSIINSQGFASYFLIVADFIQWANNQKIPVGPGRGSAAGSLVSYVLGITDVCPLRFGLLFERFLNPDRISPPDIDIDFCQSRRDEVIEYVSRRYGKDKVAHIITYGTMGAKGVIRDVARVMGIAYSEADKLAKLIQGKPGIQLKEAYERSEELRAEIDNNSRYQELWERSLRLEGLVRNVGIHAAGVVIVNKPFEEEVPLTLGKEGEIVTQFGMGALEKLGILKMDFLGLRNLTVIQDTENLIGRDFKVNEVSLDDRKTFDLLERGETLGVFQLESQGITQTCRKYGIDRIEDIIDLLALYRPGAMEFIDEMIKVKRGKKKPRYKHPLLEKICSETCGIIIYQEQVQEAAKLLAGYTLGSADILRRAMGKKDPKEMAEQREVFVSGCYEHNQINKKLAGEIFDLIEGFAGYGFNKSHSTCYGHISYWTAYLKANYPVEFMCALLSSESNTPDRVQDFLSECQRMEIQILPPDINISHLNFTPEEGSKEKQIRYGFCGVKSLSSQVIESFLKERKSSGSFKDLINFVRRISGNLTKSSLEVLIRSGAFDSFSHTRKNMLESISSLLKCAFISHTESSSKQNLLFDASQMDPFSSLKISSDSKELSTQEKLNDEHEFLGFYFSGHPLEFCRDIIENEKFLPVSSASSSNQEEWHIAGLVLSVKKSRTRKGEDFAVWKIQDFSGMKEVICWPRIYKETPDSLFEEGKILEIKVRYSARSSDNNQLEAREAKSLVKGNPSFFNLSFSPLITEEEMKNVKNILLKYSGESRVRITFSFSEKILSLKEKYSVQDCPQLREDLSPWLD